MYLSIDLTQSQLQFIKSSLDLTERKRKHDLRLIETSDFEKRNNKRGKGSNIEEL